MRSSQENNLDNYIKTAEFKDTSTIWGGSRDSYATRNNTSRIMEHQKVTLQAEQQIINTLKDIVQNITIFKDVLGLNMPINDDPNCLRPYKANAASINKIGIGSIIAALQYHLGTLGTPGTNTELANFKEKKIVNKNREKMYSLDALKKFISPDNETLALIILRLNEGVKMHLCQLAVHQDLDKEDRKRCVALLSRSEALTLRDEYTHHLVNYHLAQIEKMLISQQINYEKKIKSELKKQKIIYENQFNQLKNQMDQVIKLQQQMTHQLTNLDGTSNTPDTNKFSLFASSHKQNKPLKSEVHVKRERSYSL